MTFGMTLGQDLVMVASSSMFYIAINYKKNKANMTVAASNINNEIHQLFSKQWILRVCVTITQPKSSGDLTRTCSWITTQPHWWK